MRKWFFVSIIATSLLHLPLAAQEVRAGTDSAGSTLKLTLASALELARGHNYDIRIATASRDEASADLAKSASVFLPQLSITESFVSTNDPLNVFGLKLKQEIVTPADFDPRLLNSPPSIQNFTTKAEVRQPILNVDGFFGRHAAAKAAEASDYSLVRTEYGAELQTKLSYYGLVLARQSLSVIVKALETASAYRDQAKNFYNQGLIQKSDYLMAEVRVLDLESKKIETEKGIADAANSLRHTLGLPGSATIEPLDTLRVFSIGDVPVSIDELSGNRSDMRALLSGIDAAGAMANMARGKFIPSLNAFANYELNNDHFSGTSGKNWMVGAVLQWNIFSGFDQIGDLEKASAKQSNLESQYARMKSSARNEMASTLGAIESSRKRVALADAQVQQGEEQLRVVSDRYARGLERTTDLLQSEASLSNARLSRLQILFQHASNVFMLEFYLERKLIP